MRLKNGQRVPDFSLRGVDGRMYSLSRYLDKIKVVIFTCNHCPYAKAYQDRIVAIQREFGPLGVHVIAINSNDDENYTEDSFDEMVKRAKEKGYNFPYL